ncbi:GntR family transcriptional regulator [Ilyomonas limi]|uniref:GntR family transcriptional regulator n=1 Tax=Ilyomonas limi TaxID=2575867 RepID=A0A4U3L3M4_9BACT|nr:GntR family transcriptional regulator [Ilyomonas limi]TKK69761.1 GntR family transcriptional regulator [Ilyomonas limi]
MNKAVSDIIQIDSSLVTPVYKQIVQSIIRNIESGALTRDDTLPSVNKIAEEFSLARGSVFTAYNDLRASGIIDSVPGKGYYISSTETKQNKRIFVLFNSFSFYKETLYQALVSNLPKAYTIDVFFYNNSLQLFETQIRQHAGHYNLFIITPLVNENTPVILSHLDPKSVLMLETGYKEYKKYFAGVFQNSEKDIYSLLVSSGEALSKYKRLILIVPNNPFAKDIIAGFNKFSKKATSTAGIRTTVNTGDIKEGDAYIVTEDNDLVTIVKYCNLQKWKLGKEIGVISYNESNLKSIIADGITTFSIDYEAMGKAIAEMITSRRRGTMENTCIMIDRKSF